MADLVVFSPGARFLSVYVLPQIPSFRSNFVRTSIILCALLSLTFSPLSGALCIFTFCLTGSRY
jgi:hypothetical protein